MQIFSSYTNPISQILPTVENNISHLSGSHFLNHELYISSVTHFFINSIFIFLHFQINELISIIGIIQSVQGKIVAGVFHLLSTIKSI